MPVSKSLKQTLILIFILVISGQLSAKEGMWLPPTLKTQENQMKALGLEIPIELIYNENGTGLNNAVVLFGKGCTGEIISSKGLILTNHHCGYGTVQGLTDLEHDYFAAGFFAKNLQQEIPCPGLTVTFIRKIENVTGKILDGIADTLNDKVRDSLIAGRIKTVEAEYTKSTGLDATIKPYFEGNQYWIAITETFKDIRLVAFPPNGIGTFGGDDENWIWPRHTGDFSVFRVYAGADNKPAAYASTNKPYNATQYFHINTNGYKEGDFTMVYGFPGTTMEYISGYELNQVYSMADPISIAARTKKLDVWTDHMDANREVFLKYTSKRATVANGWKKWQGELKGLKMNKAIKKKEAYEKGFQKWADKNATNEYAKTLLPQLKAETDAVDDLLYHDLHIREEVMAIELIAQAQSTEKMMACFRAGFTKEQLSDTLQKLVKAQGWFYKNYDMATDKDVFAELMPLYVKACKKVMPAYYKQEYKRNKRSCKRWAKDVFNKSMLTSQDQLMAFAKSAKVADSDMLKNDPAVLLYAAITTVRKEQIAPKLDSYKARKHYLNRLYIKEQMAYSKDKDFYPDANLTLRVAYGKVQGLNPDGPAKYSFQTTLKDVVDLDDSTSTQFKVPGKLKELYAQKDYGRWGVNGTMPVAFIASNHTSGGNSGSPVLNSKGELIGTNFDRAYEGTMSDYLFDPNRCRNISVDIRYTLFILDKFGGAGWLMDEMTFN